MMLPFTWNQVSLVHYWLVLLNFFRFFDYKQYWLIPVVPNLWTRPMFPWIERQKVKYWKELHSASISAGSPGILRASLPSPRMSALGAPSPSPPKEVGEHGEQQQKVTREAGGVGRNREWLQWVWSFSSGWWKSSKIDGAEGYTSLNIPKTTKLYSLSGCIIGYIN